MVDETYQVVATRELDAPRDEVWRAWSESDYVRQWWGPTGFSCPRANLDFTVGGTTLVTMQAPEEYGGFLMHNGWTYTSIVEPSRIEYLLTFVDDQGQVLDPAAVGIGDGVPREVPHLVEFDSLPDGRTKVTVTESGYTAQEARDQSQAGLEQCLDKLQAIFARAR
jgi:uncharacterized protein YndB with AHSA1/START domain